MKQFFKIIALIFLFFAILIGSIFAWDYYDLNLAPRVVSQKEPILRKINGQYCLRGSMKFRTRLPQEPTVNVDYLLPCDENGTPLPDAADLVYYQSGARCRGTIDRTEIIRYASYRRLGIFCFDIFTDMEDSNFVTPEAGWPLVAFAIQEELCNRFQLPIRKLLVSGESAGASLVTQMAAAYPEKVDAVAAAGGSFFRDFPEGSHVKILLVHTWDDILISARDRLTKDLDQKNIAYLAGNTAPDWTARTNFLFYHAPGEEAFQLLEAYLAGIALRRRAAGGILPMENTSPSEEFTRLWETRTLNPIERAFKDPSSLIELPPRYPASADPPSALLLAGRELKTRDHGILRDIAGYLSYLGYRVLLTTDTEQAEAAAQNVSLVILNGDAAIELLQKLAANPPQKLQSVVVASDSTLQIEEYLNQAKSPLPFRSIFLFQFPEEWPDTAAELFAPGGMVFERAVVTNFAAPQKPAENPALFRFPLLIQPR